MSQSLQVSTQPDSSASDITLYHEGDPFFNDLLKAIDAARSEILFETYIFSYDEVGEKVLAALTRAQARGVIVRLLVDGMGSYFSSDELQEYTDRTGLPMRIFHPTLSQRLFDVRGWRAPRTYFRLINNRDHRKMTLIDGHILFMGSMNVTRNHLRSLAGSHAWRDTGLRYVSAEPLEILRRTFRRTWLRARGLKRIRLRMRRRMRLKGKFIKAIRQSRFRLNEGLRQRIWLWRDLRRRMKRAEKRILVTNAYFLPKASLLRVFRAAARRGVFVGICIPYKTDVWMVREAGRVMLRKLLDDGVHVYEYQPSVLHAKNLIIDDWATVGSYNLNHRSLFHDLEIDFVIQEKKTLDELVAQWDLDVANSHTITLNELDQDSWLRRLTGRFFYLLRYWM